MPELDDERILFVVQEYTRLIRKLKRMPGGNDMLPVDRPPDISVGETIIDVVRPHIQPDARDVMDAAIALRDDLTRIHEIYMAVVWKGEEEAATSARRGEPPQATDDEVRAVARCAAEIERAEPKLRRFREAAERRRR